MKREKKQKPYNPFVTRTIRTFKVGCVRGYIKAVKPNPFNKYGVDLRKHDPNFDAALVYYYEVGANDGSYRKCTTKADAEERFNQLYHFECRQTEIR